MATYPHLITAVRSGALVLLMACCAAPKYSYYFDKQSYGARTSQREMPAMVGAPVVPEPAQPVIVSSSTAKAVEPTKAIPRLNQEAFLESRTQGAVAATPGTSAENNVRDVRSSKEQTPAQGKKGGWMGITSFLLILGGLLLVMKANWEWFGAGMILTGLVLAIITIAKKGKSKRKGEKATPKNAGAAKAGLFVLGLVALVLIIISVIAFSSMF